MLCYVMYACLSVSMSMSTCMCIYMYVYVYVYVYMYICTRNCICICRASRIWKVVWQLFNPLPNQLLLLIVSRVPCTPCGFRPTHLPTELPEKKDICHQWKPTLGQWASSSNQGEFWDQDSTQKTTQKTIQGIQGIQGIQETKSAAYPGCFYWNGEMSMFNFGTCPTMSFASYAATLPNSPRWTLDEAFQRSLQHQLTLVI